MSRRLLVAAVALAMIAGCAYRTRGRVVAAADLGDPSRTLITNYLSAPIRAGSPTEQAPGPISRAAVSDEAWIEKLDAANLCFGLRLRTASTLDAPLGDLRFEVNGEEAWADEVTVSVRDYPYTGEREVLVADAVAASSFAALRLTQPEEKVFRVIERTARVCAPKDAWTKAELTLSVVLPMDDRRGNWGETFTWTLR